MYLTGEYTLLILRITDDEIDFENPYYEYVFYPNPTDIDRQINIPNNIQPDQMDGFYIDVNKPGVFYITIRGNTGQKKKSRTDRIAGAFGVSGVAEIASLVGLNEQEDGYTEYIRLSNFFYDWFSAIGDDPSGYAMIFVNAKDGEFYRVLPMSLQFPRTAARPLHYGYSITLQAIDEQRPNDTEARSTLDRINAVRNNINRWKRAIMDSIIGVSYLAQHITNVGIGVANAEASRVGTVLNAMADGLQGMAYMSTALDASTGSTRDTYSRIREKVDDALHSAGLRDNDGVPPAMFQNIAPPTRAVVGSVFDRMDEVVDELLLKVSNTNPGGAITSTDPASPYIDAYGAAIELLMSSATAIDKAPLPDFDPISSAINASRSMHKAARSGSVGMLEGREDELSSSAYYAETYMLDGTRNPKGVVQEGITSNSLSYITASILNTWGTLHNSTLSPALNSFRKAFLGMRDPSTLSPTYRMVEIRGNDTIYGLAKKYLGTWERWAEIALINDLEYPYISEDGGLYCKSKGDVIYIPSRDSRIPVELLEDLYSVIGVHDRLSLNDVFLGFDIRIDPTSKDAQYEKYDYAFVSGFDAFVQELSFALESKGGLTSDPIKGIGIKIGTKSGGLKDIALWRGIIYRFLSSDYRVEKIIKLSVQQQSGMIYFNTRLKLHGVDEEQTIASKVRR